MAAGLALLLIATLLLEALVARAGFSLVLAPIETLLFAARALERPPLPALRELVVGFASGLRSIPIK